MKNHTLTASDGGRAVMQISNSKGWPSFNVKHVGDMFPCESDIIIYIIISASEKKTTIYT